MKRTFVATFQPGPGWSPEIARHAGLRCRWRPSWTVEEGEFRGETAYLPMTPMTGLAWAPESQLVDREQV
jgi:hypothetical protein